VLTTNLTTQFADTVAFINSLEYDMNWYFSHLLGHKNQSTCAANIKGYAATINIASTLLVKFLYGQGTQ
jgi:hypothetical protein